jgi:hypothetical protein
MAAIDRVVHHSVILDMMGVDSYRVQEAIQEHEPPVEERREASNGSTSSAKVMRIQSTI